MAKSFASTGDMAEKKITFTEIGRGLYAFTAEGDPNSGIIIGDDGVIVIDAQATPAMAEQGHRARSQRHRQADQVRRALATIMRCACSAPRPFMPHEIIASETCRAMIAERGQEDWDCEYGRFPRLFRAAESIPGLTWPTVTFTRQDDALPRQAARRAAPSRPRPHRRRHRRLGAGRQRDVLRRHRRIPVGLLLRRLRTSPTGRRRSTPCGLSSADALAPGRGDALVGQAKVSRGARAHPRFPATARIGRWRAWRPRGAR